MFVTDIMKMCMKKINAEKTLASFKHCIVANNAYLDKLTSLRLELFNILWVCYIHIEDVHEEV